MVYRVLFVFLIFLFSCSDDLQKDYRIQLRDLDQRLERNPQSVLDSLIPWNASDLSNQNKAYYALLFTIACKNSCHTDENDSLINLAVDWYAGSDDYYNYARSLLYRGIMNFTMGAGDTIAYKDFKQADRICDEYQVTNNALRAKIYLYLGRMTASNSNFEMTERYLEKALNLYEADKDTVSVLMTQVNLVWNNLSKADYRAAEKGLRELEQNHSLPISVKMYIYSAYSTLYSTLENYEMALSYDKKLLAAVNEIKMQTSCIYYSASENFKRLNMLDSAALYINNAILHIDTTSPNNYMIYQSLAGVQYTNGNYKEACENYGQAYNLLFESVGKANYKKVLELEKKYDMAIKEWEMLKTKQQFGLIIALFLLVGSLVIFFLYRRMIRHRHQVENLNKEIEEIEFIENIYVGTIKTSSNIVSRLDRFSQKYLKDNPEFYEEVQKMRKQIKAESTKEISDVIKNKQPERLKLLFDKMPGLTSEEILLIIFFNYKFDNKKIADLLNTNPNNIRSKKNQLKQKLLKSEYRSDYLDSLFL
ncbi:MAG: hypothetical protein RSA53_04785 [Odoribacter sp.]